MQQFILLAEADVPGQTQQIIVAKQTNNQSNTTLDQGLMNVDVDACTCLHFAALPYSKHPHPHPHPQ